MSNTAATEIRWDVLTIGHVSRNRFWGESDDRAYRAPRCTCTLIRTTTHTIVVDPSLPALELAHVLDQRSGLSLSAVDTVFLTHFHGDHRVGLDAFPQARWYMAHTEHAVWDARQPIGSLEYDLLQRITAIETLLTPGIALLPTPGHTRGHTSLSFTSGGLQVVVAGDAAMTRDFFQARAVYFNTEDVPAALTSLDQIAALADIIVPGHDNAFINSKGSGKSLHG